MPSHSYVYTYMYIMYVHVHVYSTCVSVSSPLVLSPPFLSLSLTYLPPLFLALQYIPDSGINVFASYLHTHLIGEKASCGH